MRNFILKCGKCDKDLAGKWWIYLAKRVLCKGCYQGSKAKVSELKDDKQMVQD